MRRPCPDHRKTDPLECLRQVQNQGHGSLFLCFCSSIKSLHFHQDFPILFAELLHFARQWRPTLRDTSAATSPLLVLSRPPANQRWHERNRSLTRDILRNQEEHLGTGLLRPFATLLHLLQELYDFSSCFFYHIQGKIRRIRLLFLLCTMQMLFPDRILLVSSIPHFPRLVLHILHTFVTLPMLCPLCPLRLTTI